MRKPEVIGLSAPPPSLTGVTQDAHTYQTHLLWEGSTGSGYRAYSRDHLAVAPPSTEVQLSADPHFRGNAGLLNPEQLLVMAASSCQLLSFLAVAARRGVDVLSYEDDAVGLMPTDNDPMRITEITLRPHVVVADVDADAVVELVHEAHDECYIANSLDCPVAVHPSVSVVERRKALS